MYYNILLNENMGEIKKMTRKDAFTNFYLKKKDEDIKKIAHELIIYNNPSKLFLLTLYNQHSNQSQFII